MVVGKWDRDIVIVERGQLLVRTGSKKCITSGVRH